SMSFSLPNTFSQTIALLTAVCCLMLFSCGEEAEIRSYEIPSEYTGPVVSWELPEEWGENPDLSGPMAGSFHVKTDLGPMGRIGVMPFRESVSSVDVANMFGMELGQATIDEEKLKKISEIKKIGDREFEWIRISDNGHEGSTRTVLLALYRNHGETWLFPFIGDRDLIREQEKNFESFLASTTLRAGQVEIRAKAPALPPPPAHDSHGAPTWEIPEHWVKTSASSMRLASYEVTDGNNSKLDFSVTSFPGDVGGTLANVNRWLGQIGIDPVQEADLEQYISPIVLDEKEAQLVVAEGETDSLFAAILMVEDRSWFFKLTGNRELAKGLIGVAEAAEDGA
ncbi:MAG: hypothetical protein EBT88_17810, partial [Proteobacteria bacterium]|nr:hypothetical protein [Pseudomonadota bacterium]